MHCSYPKHLLALVLIPVFSWAIDAQTPLIDSLKMQLSGAGEDTSRVLLLDQIVMSMYHYSVDEALALAKEGVELSEKLDYANGLAMLSHRVGWGYCFKGEYEESIKWGEKALDIARKRGAKKVLPYTLNLLGAVYLNQGKSEQAIEYLFEAAQLSEELNDHRISASVYNNLGEIYQKMADYPTANKYYAKSVKMLLANGDHTNAVIGYCNLANSMDSKEEKLEYIKKAIVLGDSINSHRGRAYAYASMGDFYIREEDKVSEAIDAYRNGLKFAYKAGDQKISTYGHLFIGYAFLEKEMSDSAVYHLTLSHDIAVKNGQTDYESQAAQYLSKAHAAGNNYYEAYRWMDRCHTVYDSLYRQQITEISAEADAKYETSKKEAQITQQQLQLAQQKNQQNQIIIGGLFLLALVAGIFQYFFYRQRRKKTEIELALKTELAEAERLRQLDEMKTRFFTNVSHELRTPLTLIMSPLEESLKNLKQVNLEPDLQLAYRNSKHLHNLMNEVLDLAKMEAGKLENEEQTITLVPLLRRMLYSFQSMADLKGITLTFASSLSEELTFVTDLPKLEKILNNLLSNAVKFTPKDGEISLSARWLKADTMVELVVEDNGSGIAPDDLPFIFDRFYQSRQGSDNQQGGTGIGLALAKQLAQLLNGDLQVESQLGKGSRFVLNLPLENVSGGESIAEVELDEKEASTNSALGEETQVLPFKPIFINNQKPKLLIVEDHSDMSQYLLTSLSKNYQCTVAFDGKEALEKLEKESFDLITSDVMMPNMDGFALREQINQREEWRKIPFILLTARTLETDKLKGLQLGVDDYITKPFNLPELEARIHNLLQNKISRDQWAEEEDTTETVAVTADEQLLQSAEQLVLERLNDPEFSVAVMAQQLGYSSRNLSRVFGKLTGLSPVKFILEIRLQKARQLLESGQYPSVTEVRYEVGIESASYFTKKFAERFGKSPKEFL